MEPFDFPQGFVATAGQVTPNLNLLQSFRSDKTSKNSRYCNADCRHNGQSDAIARELDFSRRWADNLR